MTDTEYWYRVEGSYMRSSVYDAEWDLVRRVPGDRTELRVHAHEVLKHTPKGVWVQGWGERKFVLKAAAKRWACPTVAEAIESFKARKRRQIMLLKHQLEVAQKTLAVADERLTPETGYLCLTTQPWGGAEITTRPLRTEMDDGHFLPFAWTHEGEVTTKDEQRPPHEADGRHDG